MAAFFHTRSNSFPSRPHPMISQIVEQMCRLRDSQATSTSSSSLCHRLIDLRDLHDCIDKLLLLPLAQQECDQKFVDEILDGSLRLLDVCNTTKDVLLQIKECVHELQSVIRRRQGGIESEIRRYLTSRKLAKKSIQKSLKNLKENKSAFSSEHFTIIKILKNVEAITVHMFCSLLSFISEPSQSKPSGWSRVSKFMQQKRVACAEEEANINEFATVDVTLQSFVASKTSKSDLDDLQKKLNSLELCIRDLEDGNQLLFRRIIKTRASFLNIFN